MTEVLIGGIEKREIVVVEYNEGWPVQFKKHAGILSLALGSRAVAIEHVGSTAVPGLAAKPIIDIIVVVPHSSYEATYLAPLVKAGYILRVRESEWHEQRMFRTSQLNIHIHIFSHDCVEVARQLAFRDRLRSNEEDRFLYQTLKGTLAKQDWPDMNADDGIN